MNWTDGNNLAQSTGPCVTKVGVITLCRMQALEELRQAGLDAEGIDSLQKLYTEIRAEEDRAKEAQNQGAGGGEGAVPTRPSQRGAALKLGGLATGVISRLLTTLKLIYDVSRTIILVA